MMRNEIIQLIPYFASLALAVGLLFYAQSKRDVPGINAYVWYLGGQTLEILGFIVGIATPSLAGKIFWESFQYLAGLIVVVAFPVFAVEYTDYKFRNPRLMFQISLIMPIVFALLLATNNVHHLVYANPHLQSTGFFEKLDYYNTPFIYAYVSYSYAILAAGIVILMRRFKNPYSIFRTQAAIIILGFLIPSAGTLMTLAGWLPQNLNDPTPFTTALGNLVVVWGLFRFRIFEIAPIARDKVFEAMVEPVVILNNRNNIVDINTSMLDLLGKGSEEVIGEPAKEIFDNFPIPIKLYTQVSYARAEATFELGGKNIYYELTVWPLFNTRKEMTGRIYISHDITALKELEHELRKLNAELEDRVRARTHELADAYDTTLEGWARALELRDKETEGHSRRVTALTLKIATAMNITGEDLEHIRRGAILHDIGKVGIPDSILHKPGHLTDEERIIINKHPETAYKLLAPIPFLAKAMEIPYCHHEKWNGTGYPRGLKKEAIPLAARIFAVADVWDALTSTRPYNPAWPREKAIAYLAKESGGHFDPYIVNVFLGLIEKGEI